VTVNLGSSDDGRIDAKTRLDVRCPRPRTAMRMTGWADLDLDAD